VEAMITLCENRDLKILQTAIGRVEDRCAESNDFHLSPIHKTLLALLALRKEQCKHLSWALIVIAALLSINIIHHW
jgi:hypothetical protein